MGERLMFGRRTLKNCTRWLACRAAPPPPINRVRQVRQCGNRPLRRAYRTSPCRTLQRCGGGSSLALSTFGLDGQQMAAYADQYHRFARASAYA